MEQKKKSITILMADDDPDDRFMTQEAFNEAKLMNDFRFVEDGEELMDYLYQRGKYSDPKSAPRPGIILLDLNMPRKDGREVLSETKADANLRRIPVVILTTSKEEEDIIHAYNLGSNSYITKPVSFKELVVIIKSLASYWLEIVQLPDY
ncbi:MAG: response regulator [Candidatus Brocadia sp.]|nr:response regulator [Candidatus Brocadia sp.]UJS18662.1 MAG: response regulator [Candidatus Jettenia sp.]